MNSKQIQEKEFNMMKKHLVQWEDFFLNFYLFDKSAENKQVKKLKGTQTNNIPGINEGSST